MTCALVHVCIAALVRPENERKLQVPAVRSGHARETSFNKPISGKWFCETCFAFVQIPVKLKQ